MEKLAHYQRRYTILLQQQILPDLSNDSVKINCIDGQQLSGRPYAMEIGYHADFPITSDQIQQIYAEAIRNLTSLSSEYQRGF
ncbi:hypothetical protein PSI23_05195 [Xenorhabdus sp. XENO-10]|uniref:Uncharacterized protein n=1 Tax=Xenorhabdus yunnanensis TaxID=3025878 RepID=A0ABT5LCB2_9GAMM|nr:hypothetical protein [Xenorhabdus yunnanensis]MDC9588726.1 hypothetical protein [Xenorhabdus yunnanensis]